MNFDAKESKYYRGFQFYYYDRNGNDVTSSVTGGSSVVDYFFYDSGSYTFDPPDPADFGAIQDFMVLTPTQFTNQAIYAAYTCCGISVLTFRLYDTSNGKTYYMGTKNASNNQEGYSAGIFD